MKTFVWGLLLVIVMVAQSVIQKEAYQFLNIRRKNYEKIINKPEDYVTEMLEGLYIAHSDLITCTGGDVHCLVAAHKKPGKVGIATGGGSGHLPLFLGYVGKGMLDGCSVGDVFQSPSAEQMLAVTREIDSGAGVLYIYGNYNGDIFNFDMAAEMADFESSIRVESVVAGEDVASAAPTKPGEKNTRRGVAGIFFLYKCAGAAADKMMNLDEVRRIAEKAAANVRTMGVALTPAPCRASAGRASPSRMTKWRSAWGSTASRGSAAASWSPRTGSPTKCSKKSSPTCPTRRATRSRCWSTGWARRRSTSSTSSPAASTGT